MQKPKRLLMVGGGHAHVFLIKQFYLKNVPDLEVVLISASQYQYYSGMAAGFIEGIYKEEDIFFDLKKMCHKSGVAFIEGRVTEIDPQNRVVKLENHEITWFDILSVDTGSEMAGKSVEGLSQYAWCIKPLENLSNLRTKFIEEISDGFQVVIAGAGAAGIEVAFALKAISDKMNIQIKIKLVNSGPLILKGYKENIREKTLRKLSEDKIEVLLGHKIIGILENSILMESRNPVSYDFLIWAVGPAANPMYRASGLKVDQGGYMVVNRYLQSVDYPFIFGAGDCISFSEFEYVKKAGVYAIREAPYLFHNILRFIKNEALQEYIPQKDYLAILSAGNKKGLLQYNRIAMSGYLSWKLKNLIDFEFMKKFKFYQ